MVRHVWRILGKFRPFYVSFCVERYVDVVNGLLENTAEEIWGDYGIWLKLPEQICGKRVETSWNIIVRDIWK